MRTHSFIDSRMSTTTIRLPEQLKNRVAHAAKRVGKTTHAFILDAVSQRVEDDERQNDFITTAEQRYQNIVSTGKTISWDKMRIYLEDQCEGKKATKPRAKKLIR